MSEQNKAKSYMQQLDEWTDANVISPLYVAYYENSSDSAREHAEEAVHKAIREKALESYRNGQAAGPAKADNRRRYVKR
jgi:hypothetical protein